MEKTTNIKSWYLSEGCKDINKQLLELEHKNLGQVPVSNLIPSNYCEDISKIIDLLVDDGAIIDVVTYTDDSVEYFFVL